MIPKQKPVKVLQEVSLFGEGDPAINDRGE
jgi:hypothetical protein